MSSTDFHDLRQKLQRPNSLKTDLAAYEKYCHDATESFSTPAALLLAETVADIKTAIEYCVQHGVPIVPRGAGTGLSGGCIASSNALLLSAEAIAHLIIDKARQIAYCGPGLMTKTLQDEAAKLGLAYPPDPASYTESSLGGNVAENAGGLRCKRYGVTRDYVLGLRAVLMDGTELQTGIYTDGRGFGLGDLLIGSEGTLAVITEIAFQLTPPLGRGTTILASFNTPEDAARTVSDIIATGLIPNVMEYVDGGAAELSAAYERNDSLGRVAALLLIETAPESDQFQTEIIHRTCNRYHSVSIQTEPNSAKADPLWAIRRNISKALKEMAAVRVSEDVAVPVSRFADLVAYVAERNAVSSLRVNSFGHVGDGNLHVNFLSMTGSEADKRAIGPEIDALMAKTVALGGTITGEHGVGLAKRKYLPLEFDSPTLAAMKRCKTLFDPSNLLNPDKIF
jgi:glycolate oxidase subunit GlcD